VLTQTRQPHSTHLEVRRTKQKTPAQLFKKTRRHLKSENPPNGITGPLHPIDFTIGDTVLRILGLTLKQKVYLDQENAIYPHQIDAPPHFPESAAVKTNHDAPNPMTQKTKNPPQRVFCFEAVRFDRQQ